MKTGLLAVSSLAIATMSASAFAQMPTIPRQQTPAETAALAAQGARSGHDAMTCDQIGMEMQPYVQTAMPSINAMGHTGGEIKALQDKQKAEAIMQAPMGVGAAIAGSFLPGGGMLAQAQAASQFAQMQKRSEEARPLQQKMKTERRSRHTNCADAAGAALSNADAIGRVQVQGRAALS